MVNRKLCQYCNERRAWIHVTEIKDGTQTEMHVCEPCAIEKNLVPPYAAGMLDGMDPLDRKVWELRRFGHLSNAETATRLGIDTSAVSKHYIRALRHLKKFGSE